MKAVQRRNFGGLGSTLRRHGPIGLLAYLVGCSVLYDLNSDQCETAADCDALGEDFAGRMCVSGTCVKPNPTTGSGGASSSSNTNSSNTTSMAGQGGEPGCTSNEECIDDNLDQPYVCRDGECINLLAGTQCPLIVGGGKDLENLKIPEPIIIGAFSKIDPQALRISAPTLNYEFALNEVNDPGLPGGPNGTRRKFVAVICDGVNPDLDVSMPHLLDTLKVPALISSLYTRNLLKAFEQYNNDTKAFFLSPLEADTSLTTVEDDGRMWHMLGSALDLAPGYVPLVQRTEAYMRDVVGDPEDGEPLRVAMVQSRNPFVGDLADYVFDEVTVNGMSVSDNDDAGNLVRITTDSSWDGGFSESDAADAIAEILEFAPHVVLALSTDEFVDYVLPAVEEGWFEANQFATRPFYLLSPYLFGPYNTLEHAFTFNLPSRILGINFAAAEDDSLYTAYLSDLEAEYGDEGISLTGTENFYDAAYFLMYAVLAAGEVNQLRGSDVARGMTRLISGTQEYDVGDGDQASLMAYLRSDPDAAIALQGTLGPPDFNPGSGARKSRPSVFCVDWTDDSHGATEYVPDVVDWDPDAKTLEDTEPPCVEGF